MLENFHFRRVAEDFRDVRESGQEADTFLSRFTESLDKSLFIDAAMRPFGAGWIVPSDDADEIDFEGGLAVGHGDEFATFYFGVVAAAFFDFHGCLR